MEKISIILLLFAFLSGCSVSSKVANQELEPSVETFVGLTTYDLIQKKGLPNSVVIFPAGESFWIYKSLKTDLKKSLNPPGENSGLKSSTLTRIETIVF